MALDLAAVAREAAARWRQDRAILRPLSGLLLFVPQWAVLLLVPDPPVLAGSTPAAILSWETAMGGWVAGWGALYLAAFLVTQVGQLSILALYLPAGEPPTVAGAIGRAGRMLPRYLLAGAAVALPLATGGVIGLGQPLLLALLLPAIFWVLGRTMLVGAAILARRGTGALAAVRLSWRWTHGRGAGLALLVGGLLVAMTAVTDAASLAEAALAQAGIASRAVTAALDALAAAAAWAAMLALTMMQVVLYRRLAR